MNHKIRLKTRVSILNFLVRSRLTFACQTWTLSARHRYLLNSTYCGMLRRMIRNGFNKKEDECGAEASEEYIRSQQKRCVAHIICSNNEAITKRLTFNSDESLRPG